MFSLFLSTVVCGCPVYVMAPLDLFNDDQTFKDKSKISKWLSMCQSGGVDGVMIDIWWGLTEPTSGNYKFSGYSEFFNMCVQNNLKIVPVFSFHKCGGNVGDITTIPLPSFVTSQSPFFIDANGNVDDEYISFGYDQLKISGRTPITMYKDFMTNFRNKFSSLIDSGSIVEIEIGLGPCGELRYPSYREATSWSYPGCGTFQAFDFQMKSKLEDYSIPIVGQNDTPFTSLFWKSSYKTPEGSAFLKKYHEILVDHAKTILDAARTVFHSAKLSGKIAGLHWWYNQESHCIETTAGYNNFYDYDGYKDIIKIFKKFNIQVCFTCLELTPDRNYLSDPPALVNQILGDTIEQGLDFEGENALACYDSDSYNRIRSWVSKGLSAFTYLRMDDNLMGDNWNGFVNFVQQMHMA